MLIFYKQLTGKTYKQSRQNDSGCEFLLEVEIKQLGAKWQGKGSNRALPHASAPSTVNSLHLVQSVDSTARRIPP